MEGVACILGRHLVQLMHSIHWHTPTSKAESERASDQFLVHARRFDCSMFLSVTQVMGCPHLGEGGGGEGKCSSFIADSFACQ